MNVSTENNATAATAITRYKEQVVSKLPLVGNFCLASHICMGGSGPSEGCAASFGKQGKM